MLSRVRNTASSALCVRALGPEYAHLYYKPLSRTVPSIQRLNTTRRAKTTSSSARSGRSSNSKIKSKSNIANAPGTRTAFTSPPPPSPTTSTSSAAPSSEATSTLNPLLSTLPPPLNLPTRQEGQSTPSYLFALGKSYAGFYKNGLFAVWGNGKAARALLAEKGIRPGSAAALAAARNTLTKQPGFDQPHLDRAQFQLLRRSAADVRRIPLFALLFALCGEFTPLVVVFASPLVPRTCRIPKQVHRERTKALKRRQLSLQDIGLERLREGGDQAGWKVEGMDAETVRHVGRAWAVYGQIWDLTGLMPVGVVRRRVKRWQEYLEVDDEMLRRGGVAELSNEEVTAACEERGLDVLDEKEKEKGIDQLRRCLKKWLDSERVPAARVLLDN